MCEMVGKGGNGNVYKAMDNKDYSLVAIKQLLSTKQSSIDSSLAELNLLQQLQCDHIVKYIGYYPQGNHIHFVMEFVGGSLLQRIQYSSGLTELQIVKYLFQLLIALHYIHSRSIIHCDIKSANILVNKEGKVKLADFGAAFLSPDPSSLKLPPRLNKQTSSSQGSPYWSSPPLLFLPPISLFPLPSLPPPSLFYNT